MGDLGYWQCWEGTDGEERRMEEGSLKIKTVRLGGGEKFNKHERKSALIQTGSFTFKSQSHFYANQLMLKISTSRSKPAIAGGNMKGEEQKAVR